MNNFINSDGDGGESEIFNQVREILSNAENGTEQPQPPTFKMKFGRRYSVSNDGNAEDMGEMSPEELDLMNLLMRDFMPGLMERATNQAGVDRTNLVGEAMRREREAEIKRRVEQISHRLISLGATTSKEIKSLQTGQEEFDQTLNTLLDAVNELSSRVEELEAAEDARLKGWRKWRKWLFGY